MSYVLNYSSGTITVPIGTADTTTTSLTLVGRNWTSTNINEGYGQAINQNYLSLLENFASAPVAGPANPINGQLWHDTSNATLMLNISTTTTPNWQPLLSAGGNATFANITVTDTANISNITTGSNVLPGTITGAWTLTTGSTLNATYADLAEYYLIDQPVQPGTVVEFGGTHEITRCDTDMSHRVAGVISTDPAFVMNAGVTFTGNAQPVALQGRVPCLVVGTASKGDLMVSAGNGYARSERSPQIGTVIGKSLEHKHTAEAALIEISVGRT